MTGCEKSPRSPQPAAARVLDVGEQFRGLAGPPWPRGALRPEKMHFPRTGEREPARAAGRAPGARAGEPRPSAGTSSMLCAFSDTHETHRRQLVALVCRNPMIGAASTTLDLKNSTEAKERQRPKAACTRHQGPWWSKLRVLAAGRDVRAAARGGPGPALARRGAWSGSNRFRQFYSVVPVGAP